MRHYEPKPEFISRIAKLLPDKKDNEKFWKIIRTSTPDSIRCNSLKIKPSELLERLKQKGWKIKQPFSQYPEVMIVESNLMPGELGKTREHLLGYYYVQEISSMLPMLALNPKAGESVLDLCASPGSKTTQAAALMENKGLIIANDKDIKRIKILASNLQKCGVMNVIITRMNGVKLCEKLAKKTNMKFDKILVDAPCSGEGTLRKSPKTLLAWNKKFNISLSGLQKKLAASCLQVLKTGGEMIYSTCTLSPEENEEVVDFLIKNFNVEIEEVKLPLKCRRGLTEFESESFNKEIENACRVWPQDNDTDGFFLAKLKKLGKNEIYESK